MVILMLRHVGYTLMNLVNHTYFCCFFMVIDQLRKQLYTVLKVYDK
jgi:hypothetical protein